MCMYICTYVYVCARYVCVCVVCDMCVCVCMLCAICVHVQHVCVCDVCVCVCNVFIYDVYNMCVCTKRVCACMRVCVRVCMYQAPGIQKLPLQQGKMFYSEAGRRGQLRQVEQEGFVPDKVGGVV